MVSHSLQDMHYFIVLALVLVVFMVIIHFSLGSSFLVPLVPYFGKNLAPWY